MTRTGLSDARPAAFNVFHLLSPEPGQEASLPGGGHRVAGIGGGGHAVPAPSEADGAAAEKKEDESHKCHPKC